MGYPSAGTVQGNADADLQARLDAAIESALVERRIVGTVVLVARDGGVVYRRAAGFARREANEPMREDSIFLLASVTKPIVSLALMQLLEEGRIRLNDPVTRWLPDFRPRLRDGTAPEITIHHLLTHTAGLSYEFMEPADGPYRRLRVSNGLDQPGLSLEENLRRAAAAPLSYAPGSGWGYSIAIDVLGAVIARASGRSLPDQVRARVTRPLGMNDTGFGIVDAQRLVQHYADGTPEPTPMGEECAVPLYGMSATFAPGRLFDPASYPSGGAGMAGTAGDILRFLEAVRTEDRRLASQATMQLMRQPHVGPSAQTQGPGWGFGYGWAVLVDPVQAGSPQSAGTLQWGGAYGHSWFVDPVNRLTVVAFTNTAFEGMVGKFPADVRDAVYGQVRAPG